jgi:hypothetical protein
MFRLLLAVFILGCSCSVNAQRAWVCSYPGSNPKEPVVLKYSKAGDYLVESQFGVRYRILQDSKYALVAAWFVVEGESSQSEVSIGVLTVMIDKTSKRYRRSVAGLNDVQERADVGKCESK